MEKISDSYDSASQIVNSIDHHKAIRALLMMAGVDLICCPECRTIATDAQETAVIGGGRARCNSCGKWYGWSSGTIYHGSSLSPAQLVVIMSCAAAGVGVALVAKITGCHRTTVRSWYTQAQEIQAQELSA